MEELRFEIAEDMEDERIDKCMSLLAEESVTVFYSEADQRWKCSGQWETCKRQLSCQV